MQPLPGSLRIQEVLCFCAPTPWGSGNPDADQPYDKAVH